MASIRERRDPKTQQVNRWQVLFREPKPGKPGKWTQGARTFTDERVARQFLVYIEATGSHDKAEELLGAAQARKAHVPTVDEWVERYLARLTGITDGTRHGYRRSYELNWQPLIGHVFLDVLDTDRAADALNRLAARDRLTRHGDRTGEKVSATTIRHAYTFLSTALNAAVDEGLILKNPFKKLRLPKGGHDRHENLFFSHAEFDDLLAATPARYQPLVLTLAGTGMRWGEATALDIASLDLDAGTVRITRAWKYNPGGGMLLGPPKTEASRRTVTLPPTVTEELGAVVRGRSRDALVFTVQNGGPIRQAYFHTCVWRPALERAGFPAGRRPRIHDLRHSHVAWLIAAGTPLPVIQRRLGHEDIRTTINTYGHLLPDLQRQAAEAADAVFGPRAITS